MSLDRRRLITAALAAVIFSAGFAAPAGAKKKADAHKQAAREAAATSSNATSLPVVVACLRDGRGAAIEKYFLALQVPFTAEAHNHFSDPLEMVVTVVGVDESGEEYWGNVTDGKLQLACPGEPWIVGSPAAYPRAQISTSANGGGNKLNALLAAYRAQHPERVPLVSEGGKPKLAIWPAKATTVRELVTSYWNKVNKPINIVADPVAPAVQLPVKFTMGGPWGLKNKLTVELVSAASATSSPAMRGPLRPDSQQALARRDIELRLSATDARILKGADLAGDIASPACGGVERVDRSDAYRLRDCIVEGTFFFVRIAGFEPARARLDASGGSATLDELTVSAWAIPEPQAGDTPYSVQGQFSELSRYPQSVRHAVRGCERQVVVSLENLRRRHGLTIQAGNCVKVVLSPAPAGGAGRAADRVTGCLGRTAEGDCWVEKGPNAYVSVKLGEGFDPLKLAVPDDGRVDLNFEGLAGRLFAKAPPGLSTTGTWTPSGADAPTYRLQSMSANDQSASCRQAVQLQGPSLLAIAALNCARQPKRITYLLSQVAAPGGRSAIPPDAFERELSIDLDTETGAFSYRGVRFTGSYEAKDLKRQFPVSFGGQFRNSPDFQKKVMYVREAADGDCARADDVTIGAGGAAPSQLAKRTWPTRAMLLDNQFVALTPCTTADLRGGVLDYNFQSIVEPGPRTMIVWTPDFALDQAARKPILAELNKLMERSEGLQRQQRRARYDVFVAGPDYVEELFSGEAFAANPAEARAKIARLPSSGGPPVPNIDGLDKKIVAKRPDVTNFIVIMNGKAPLGQMQMETSVLATWLNRLASNPATTSGKPPTVSVFTLSACREWRIDLKDNVNCIDIDDKGIKSLQSLLANAQL